jgi:hypothetical protein
MTDNIIDKSFFFRRRAKPTKEENEERFSWLMDQHCQTLQDLFSDEFTSEQRVAIMTKVFDFAYYAIKINQGADRS